MWPPTYIPAKLNLTSEEHLNAKKLSLSEFPTEVYERTIIFQFEGDKEMRNCFKFPMHTKDYRSICVPIVTR